MDVQFVYDARVYIESTNEYGDTSVRVLYFIGDSADQANRARAEYKKDNPHFKYSGTGATAFRGWHEDFLNSENVVDVRRLPSA